MLLLTLALGCGQSPPTPPSPPALSAKSAAPAATPGAAKAPATSLQAVSADPASAVREFLEAVRTGNDKQAQAMISQVAAENLKKQNLNIAPQGTDTARFEVGKVEMLSQDGARVTATWTDYDERQQPKSDPMLWMLRKEPEGWRIVGAAFEIFPGEPPLLLDFEKPEEVSKKMKWAAQEMQRRRESQNLQAQQPQNSANNVQR